MTVINKKAVGVLSSKLSDWYFSECGGLLLTPQARDFYFELQDLLRATSRIPEEWSAARSKEPEGAHNLTFRTVLKARNSNEAISVLDYFSEGKFENWQEKASDLGKKWRIGIIDVAAASREQASDEPRHRPGEPASLKEKLERFSVMLATDACLFGIDVISGPRV